MVFAIFLVDFIYFVRYRPFVDKLENLILIVNSLIYVTVLIIFFGILIFGEKLSQEENNRYWGNALIGLLILNITVSLIICLLGVFKSAVNSFIKVKGWICKGKKIGPESQKKNQKFMIRNSFSNKTTYTRATTSTSSIASLKNIVP